MVFLEVDEIKSNFSLDYFIYICGSYVLLLIIFYICVKQLESNERPGKVFVVEQGSSI